MTTAASRSRWPASGSCCAAAGTPGAGTGRRCVSSRRAPAARAPSATGASSCGSSTSPARSAGRRHSRPGRAAEAGRSVPAGRNRAIIRLCRHWARSMRNPLAGPGNGLADVPDEDLMLLVARGLVQEPATELFARHNRDLFNFLAWLCGGNLAEAEDLAQKTWLKLITRCADYQPGAAAFRTYLFQIARNAFLDARRAAGERLREDIDVHVALEAGGPRDATQGIGAQE